MFRKSKIIFWLLVSLRGTLWVSGYWFLSYSSVNAQELKAKEPVVVNGDKVEYFQERKQVVGTGNISITYKDVVLTCDKVTVYLDTREAIAEGNVKITQKDAYFTGEKINYNFDTRLGKVIDGYVNSKPFYGRADEIAKTSDKEIDLEHGYVTTCDLDKPHYRVQAKQVEIYLDDRVVAKHIFFFVGNVPIMYFPYYVQPIDKERSAHATLELGKDKDWGYYALTSYRYYFSEIANGRILLDYRSKKGLAEGIDNYYSIEGIGSGSARFYYTHENDAAAYEKTGETESKYRFQVRHRWDMGYDTVAMLEFNKLRDQNFIKDYFYKEYEEEGAPDNYLSFTTTKRDYTTTLLLRKRFDKYFNVVERLPEFSVE
ncbi:MAG: LPS-assembly protein LptD, partial [Candidatus Omnitrophica bacterium]|nr:LPS-assembly protein LptD [Candidatus Omnitrophota bacterium]